MGSYASQKLADPEIFVTELVALLVRYPRWAGEQATAAARKASPDYLPSVPKVEELLEEHVRPFRYARQFQVEAAENQRLLEAAKVDPAVMRRKLVGLGNELRGAGGKSRVKSFAEAIPGNLKGE